MLTRYSLSTTQPRFSFVAIRTQAVRLPSLQRCRRVAGDVRGCRDAVALIRDHVRGGRGLPPRQTMRLNHASSEVNGEDPLPTAAATEDTGSPIAVTSGISK